MAERKVSYGRLGQPQIGSATRADPVIVMPGDAIKRPAPRLPADRDPQLARGMRRIRAIIAAPRRFAAGGEASRRQATAAGAR